MAQYDPQAFTRRAFLNRGVVLASASLAVPSFLQRSAFAMAQPGTAGIDDNRVLVVVQLSGGNDGLNTVVPFGDAAYYRARPGIGIAENAALKLDADQGLGLHPSLAGLKEMYDEGLLSVVQGVGYPNPNRSHFVSMDIWHTADTDGTGEGWLGRYIDHQCCGYGKGESGTPDAAAPAPNTMPSIALMRTAPLALEGIKSKPIAFETPELFRWTGSDVHESLTAPYDALTTRGGAEGADAGSNADFLLRTALDAQVSSEMIRKAVSQSSLVEYPRSELAQQLSMVASMIRAGLKTRVYYVSHGGFDTHAGQGGAQGNHARLLQTYAEAMRAFYRDLKAQENDTRVLTMTFSEFGRRVGQNASGGTDHGTAAPMFLAGPMVRAGVHGDHPSLKNLEDGDLKFGTDFRSVYAGIAKDWLQTDPKVVLKGSFSPLRVLKKA